MDKSSKCSLCGEEGIWFDSGGYYGVNEIECICPKCLASGKLKDHDIEANITYPKEVYDSIGEEKGSALIDVISYQTPQLPVLQDGSWPFMNGDFCIFEKIASKHDFQSKEEFRNSFSKDDQENSDLDWLWDVLPEHEISSLKNGNYDISVYLFTNHGAKYCTWDAS